MTWHECWTFPGALEALVKRGGRDLPEVCGLVAGDVEHVVNDHDISPLVITKFPIV